MFSFEMIDEIEKTYWYKTLWELSRANEDIHNFLFGDEWEELEDGYDAACNLCDGYRDYNGSVVTVMCGVSKLCFVSTASNLVIKIPFTNTDFCAIEELNYRTGSRLGLDRYLAGTVMWQNYSNYFPNINFPLYFAERMCCNIVGGKYDEITYTSRDKCCNDNIITFFKTSDIDYIVRFQYGTDIYEQLMDFCVECDINDMHGGNVMYDKNGNIRFIDYSGFRCDSDKDYGYDYGHPYCG